MAELDAPWVARGGIPLNDVFVTYRAKIMETCPECGQSLYLTHAKSLYDIVGKNKQGKVWMRPECRDCGWTNEAVSLAIQE